MDLFPKVMNAFLKELKSDKLQVSVDQPAIRLPPPPEANTCLKLLGRCSLFSDITIKEDAVKKLLLGEIAAWCLAWVLLEMLEACS